MNLKSICLAVVMTAAFALPAAARDAAPATSAPQDSLLAETVGFTGAVLFYRLHVPGLVIGAVHNGEKVVEGFGRVAGDGSRKPDGDTLLRIGSVTKVFTGAALASLVADGSVRLTDPLAKYLHWGVPIPSRDGKSIRLIDLATHTSGLPREVEREPGPPNDPMKTITKAAFVAQLKSGTLLFPPGTGALYSNFAFDLLAAGLSSAAHQPYETLLEKRVLQPAGLTATTFAPSKAQRENLFQGHGADGSPMPDVPNSPMVVGSGGLYSTADDILRWVSWHLARFDKTDAEMRLLDHTAFVPRSALSPAFGLDESGHADAIGLGWIVMNAQDERPRIIQKAGGLQGVFTYLAIAPDRGTGVFVAINKFDFAGAMAMAEAANQLIAELVPR